MTIYVVKNAVNLASVVSTNSGFARFPSIPMNAASGLFPSAPRDEWEPINIYCCFSAWLVVVGNEEQKVLQFNKANFCQPVLVENYGI